MYNWALHLTVQLYSPYENDRQSDRLTNKLQELLKLLFATKNDSYGACLLLFSCGNWGRYCKDWEVTSFQNLNFCIKLQASLLLHELWARDISHLKFNLTCQDAEWGDLEKLLRKQTQFLKCKFLLILCEI